MCEKEELPDARPVAVADRPAGATGGKTRGRKPGEHFAAAYANGLRASAKAAAENAAAGCGANDAPTKAVEAVFKAAKVGDDVFAAVNDVSKANMSRRNAGLKDIALRICDAFLAARAGAGITTLYPKDAHLGNNDDKPLLQKVEELVWTRHVAPRVQKNKDKVRKELKPPTRNGYQLEIRENVIQADDNDDEEDVPIARRARAARARLTSPPTRTPTRTTRTTRMPRTPLPATTTTTTTTTRQAQAQETARSQGFDHRRLERGPRERRRRREARRRRRRALRRVVSAARSRYRRDPGVRAGRGVQIRRRHPVARSAAGDGGRRGRGGRCGDGSLSRVRRVRDVAGVDRGRPAR